MRQRDARQRSTVRVFAVYAVVTAVLVLLFGVALAAGYRAEAERRGLAAGTSEALLVAQTAIEPRLDNVPLDQGLSTSEKSDMSTLAQRALGQGSLLRLRLRDLSGKVVFSDDGSGFNDTVEGEVLEAAKGKVVSLVTAVNSDSNDQGVPGQQSVEVYMPLMGGSPAQQVGVLEIYLPYAPIASEIEAGTHELYLLLGIGVSVLYLALFFVSLSVTRGLRRQLTVNSYLAERDALTDLPNRWMYQRWLTRVLGSAFGDGHPTAVAYIDLDRFKVVNDTLGYQYGDRMLIEVASRLSGHLEGKFFEARLGGDEFGVILRDCPDPAAALLSIKESIEREITVEGFPAVSLNCSVGFVVAFEDGYSVDNLLQRAEIAMYRAKHQHLGVLRYDALQDHSDASALLLITDVKRAIEINEFVMHYQPQVQLADEKPIALEALVRWRHPTLGMLSPDQFIPLMEQTDLIHSFTDWVLSRALRDLAALGELAGDLTMAVNISASNLARSDFTERVATLIAASPIAPERLTLEITETALLTHPERARTALLALSALGVRISLDDFGVGQTSLSRVAALPIAELKIDKSFVTDMTGNAVHAAIVRSIVDLGAGLSMRVVAEGVETASTATALSKLGCNIAQGNLFCTTRRLTAIHDWLETHV